MKILVAYDGSIYAAAALEDMRRAGLPDQAEALILCVADGGTRAPESYGVVDADLQGLWRGQLAEAEALGEIAANRLQSYFPRWTISSEALWGSPAKIILDSCGGWRPDLLVTGSHGRSAVGRILLGSVSLELVHEAPCSVRVVRTGGSSGVGPIQIIAGNDGSRQAEAMMKEIARRSWPKGTAVEVVSVIDTLAPAPTGLEASTFAQEPAFRVIRDNDENEWARLQNVADDSADYLRRAGLLVNPTVIDGSPREVILAKAEVFNADAIFVGARGLSSMERLLLGSVSTHVVKHARCTVEVIRSAD